MQSYQLATLQKEKSVVFTKDQFLFLLEQFCIEPSERNEEYGRRLINTFVTSMEVSDSELFIYFNVSEETVNKTKKCTSEKLSERKFA